MRGIVAYGAYLPVHRIQRTTIATALGNPPLGGGTRTVASYDEDTTTIGAEAARAALRGFDRRGDISAVALATAAPAYLDKTNATAIHAALGLPDAVAAYDLGGAARSGAGALRLGLAADGLTLIVTSDLRTGYAGGAEESLGGDAGAALLVGAADTVLAEHLATASSTAEFTDRWRTPGDVSSGQWEERFGETVYVPLGLAAAADALKQAQLEIGDVDHVLVVGLHPRAVRQVTAKLGARPESVVPDLGGLTGNTGSAQLALMLGAVLDQAEPGRTILAVSLADGADAFVFRTTDALATHRSARPLQTQLEGASDLPYSTFLTWRGQLHREPPRRPEPERVAAPAAQRGEDWKFGFVGSRCECGTRHLPPQRVCLACDAVDRMTPDPVAELEGTIVTYTVDRLAFSLSPPVVVAVIDFDGGGRFQCEMTDVDPATVQIGDRVELTFRRLFTAGGLHNYFWKARPIRAAAQEG